MCGCPEFDISLFLPISIAYIVLGAVQVISGVFYLVWIPSLKLIVHCCIGCWGIIIGLFMSLIVWVWIARPRKFEMLLYGSFILLVLNMGNVIFLEFGQIKELFSERIQSKFDKEYDVLKSPSARMIMSVTALAMILLTFIGTQISFYLLNKSQRAHKIRKCAERKNRQLYVVNDQSADLEYVIPKKIETHHPKSTSSGGNQKAAEIHNKSWVFEATGEDYDDPNLDESSVSLCSSVSPTHSASNMANGGTQSHYQKKSTTPQTTLHNGAPHSNGKQRRLSRVSDATSERFAHPMSSFSRCATPSPVPRSGHQTPTGGSLFSPQSDYMETSTTSSRPTNRLTVEFHNALHKLKPVSSASHHYHDSQDPTSLTTQPDDSPYASLLAELEQSLQEKKMVTSFSPDNTSLSTSDNKFGSSSKSSSKDLEFSKELEAALQLIQELETPSEGPFFGDLKQLHTTQQMARSDSEKTLSAAVSLPSPEAGPLVDSVSSPVVACSDSTHKLVITVRPAAPPPPPSSSTHHGKTIFSVVHEPSSQSTSGYSSPSSSNLHRDYDSSVSSGCSERTLNSFGCHNDIQMIPLSPSARTSSSSTYYEQPNLISSASLVPIISQRSSHQYINIDQPVGISKKSFVPNAIAITPLPPASRSNSLASKSFLLFKKRSTLMPQSDFQSRIFKPECLAYLTEEELVQQHRLTRNVIRKIELNVAQRVKGCQPPNNISHTIN